MNVVTFFDDKNISLFQMMKESIENQYSKSEVVFWVGLTGKAKLKIDLMESKIYTDNINFKILDGILNFDQLEGQQMPNHVSVISVARLFAFDIFPNLLSEKTIILDNDLLFFNRIPKKYLDSNENYIFNTYTYWLSDLFKNPQNMTEDEKFKLFLKNSYMGRSFGAYERNESLKNNNILSDKISKFKTLLLEKNEFSNGGVLIINDPHKFSEILREINECSKNLFASFSDEVLMNIFKNQKLISVEDKRMNYANPFSPEEKESYKMDNIIIKHYNGANKEQMLLDYRDFVEK